jgi:hypothetical protein
MKPANKILAAAGILLIVFIALAALVPIVYRDEIADLVKREVNTRVAAQVDWRDADLTLLSTFPHLTFSVDDLSITGRGAFDADTLLTVERFETGFGLLSAVRGLLSGGKIEVRSVEITRPRLFARVLEDGTANWEILKKAEEGAEKPGAREEGTEEKGFGIGIRNYRIEDAAITYDDRAGDVALHVAGLTHEGTGDFMRDAFMVKTVSHADRLSFIYGGIPYLREVTLDAKVGLEAEVTRDFLVEDSEIRVNALTLSCQGKVRKEEEGYTLDLTFRAPGTEFKEFVSLIPSVYRKDFQTLESAGTLALSGHVKGLYRDDHLPAFSLVLKVENGMFRYPGAPVAVQSVGMDLLVANPGGVLDNTLLNVKKFHAELGGESFDATLLLKNPVTDPYVDAVIKGKVDLARAKQAVPMDSVTELGGTVRAGLSLKGRVSSIERKEYDKFTASGTIEVDDLVYASPDLPQGLGVSRMRLAFSPESVRLEETSGRFGKSDFAATGVLENFFSFLLKEDALKGELEVTSRNIDLDELTGKRSEGKPEEAAPAPAALKIPGGIDFTLRARAQNVLFRNLELADVKGLLRVKERVATLEGLSMKTLGGSMTMSGTYDARNEMQPAVDLNVNMTNLDIQKAAKSLLSVRTLAPVAEYASGTFSTDSKVKGTLTENMIPEYETVTGEGTIHLAGAAVKGFKPLQMLGEQLKLDWLKTLELDNITQRFAIENGRFSVEEFEVSAEGTKMRVSGSHGLDRSLDYVIKMAVPRKMLGEGANSLLESLLSKAADRGIDYNPGEMIRFNVMIAGTFEKPHLSTDLSEQAGRVAKDFMGEVKERVDEEKEELVGKLEEKKGEAVGVGQAELERRKREADRVMGEAEAKAETIRSEARRAAERVRKEGYARAEQRESQAKDSVARQAAKTAADRMRRESDTRAQRIITEADQKAESLLDEARKRADEILGG